ncbi:hypothetical protein SteCoe_12006 [Stentor coeruleus]|uniref:STIL N-terminal domain-containing protein n=1 Tax=Stentor coeruleus TaxID=5963 RepID=A0A1R2CBY2_9CILI|nr:hypothetical protein SteCoe_12006 [Stentor coeruleus]
MSYTEASSDFQESLFILQPISLQGSLSELWNRSPKGKPVLLRMQSMLPQFKITSEVLKQLWTISNSENLKISGVCTAYKYSPEHFLSLKVTEVHCITRGQIIPPADYLLYLSPQTPSTCPEKLKSEEKHFEKMMKSIERHISREQFLEPLDICRTLLIFAADKISQKLQIKCEILYPSVSFQFTPISQIKLVSTPLSVKLIQNKTIQNKREKFQEGYLTMDQTGRVLPMLPSDPLAYKYPIVGIWVSNIPESQNHKAYPIMHPLVWANCIQFIENTNIKDKISPSLENNSFLFLHFASKPKFYEVCTLDNPSWKTSKFCCDIQKENGTFNPCYATFIREDQSNSSLEISVNLPKAINTSFTPSGSFQVSIPPSYSKPPRQSISPLGAQSNRSSDSFKVMFSPNAERIISEQNKKLAELQQQILELQAHLFNNGTPKYKKHNSVGGFQGTFTPNRFNMTSQGEKQFFNAETSCKELFQENPRLKKSISTISDIAVLPKPRIPEAKGDKTPKERFKETPTRKNHGNTSSELINLISINNTPTVKSNIEIPENKIVYNPLKYNNTSPEPSPQPYQTKTKIVQNPSENTIYVPKIQYDSGSDSSCDDEQVKAVERKYLYQS